MTRDIDLSHLANLGVLASPSAAGGRSFAGSPDDVDQPYFNVGTHPDLVTRLWNRITVGVAEDCRWITHGWPVLVRPSSGIIFGFASGTHTYGLRLPECGTS